MLEIASPRLAPGSPRAPQTGWRAWWTGSAHRLPWTVAGFFFVVYAALSIQRHRQMLTAGFDLGLFEQAVRAYAHGHAPIAPLKGPKVNLLGDHFSPIVAVLAPFYRIFPSPITLLVAQALLAALAIVPLSRWALAARGPAAALWVALGEGCSWGVVQMVDFDFHEVAFAVPLLAAALAAAGQNRWRSAALWTLPLVLVKEDMSLTVAALGIYIALRGPRRLGLYLTLFGLAAGALEIFAILPALSSSGHYTYTGQLQPTSDHGPVHAVVAAVTPLQKWFTVFALLAPTGFLALRSALTLLVVPTLAWRFLSDNPSYWGTLFHYSAVLMPIVFAAAIDTLTRAPAPNSVAQFDVRRRRPTVRSAALGFGLAYTAYTLVAFPLHNLVVPSEWRTSAHIAAAHEILADIPDGAHVAATNRLAAQLAGRTTVTLACMRTGTRYTNEPAWIIVDATDPSGVQCPARSEATQPTPEHDGYRLIARKDGITLLYRATAHGSS